MRKAVTGIESPYLSLVIDADYLTVGEIGNILIRLQAVLRILADLSRSRREQPRFIVKTLKSRRHWEILVLLSILSLTAAIPQNLDFYREVAGRAFTKLKLAIIALAENRGFTVEATKGELDLKLAHELLDGLSPRQRKKLGDFALALTRPASRIVIREDALEVVIKPLEPPKLI